MKQKRDFLNRFCKMPEIQRITELYGKGAEYPLTIVSAGPGYGKTETAAQFARGFSGSLIWLSLTSLDNSIDVFWHDLIRATKAEFPALSAEMERMNYPQSLTDFTILYRIFAKAIYNTEKTLLVIDKFHFLENPEIKSFFEQLIAADFENLHVIFIGSWNLNFPVQEFSYFMIAAKNLTLSLEETGQYLKHYNIQADAETLVSVWKRTAGWPVAVYLLSLHAENRELKPDDFEKADLSKINYLFETDFYNNYSSSVRKCLLMLSLFDEFDLGIIRLLDQEDSRDFDSIFMNHSMIFYSNTNKTYSFNPLYEDFLRKKQGFLSEEEKRQTLLKAGNWYYDNGNVIQAISCFRMCGEYDKVIEIITRKVFRIMSREYIYFYHKQLKLLPRELFSRNPILWVIQAYLYMLNSELLRAKKVLFALEEKLSADSRESSRQLLGEVYLSLGELSILLKEASFAGYYKKARALLPNGSRLRNGKLPFLGNNSFFFLFWQLDDQTKILAVDKNASQIETIEEAFSQSAEDIKFLLHGGGAGINYLYSAEAAYCRLDFNRAREMAYKAIYTAQDFEQHDIFCNSHILLVKLCLGMGQLRETQMHIDTIINYIDKNNITWLLDMKDSVKSFFATVLGNYEDNASWISNGEFYNRNTPKINSGREMLVHAYYLLSSNQYLRVVSYLEVFRDIAVRQGIWLGTIYASIMQSIAYYNIQEYDEAVAALKQAYDMTYGNHLLNPFIEMGYRIKGILELVKKENHQGFDPDWLNTILQKSSTMGKRHALLIKEYHSLFAEERVQVNLSKREKEILDLLSQGMKREEMAAYYSISISTVKKHITNIYNKLGAINRADAIYLAVKMGLLPTPE